MTTIGERNKEISQHYMQYIVGGQKGLITQAEYKNCLLYTSPSPRDATLSRMPSSA